ncbi:MAG TPA: IclR family transcriptional regulator [Dermatophilaceae bacterium]|nr:IclR family transcriptional regulator [Dermatophilaceae bacterium]
MAGNSSDTGRSVTSKVVAILQTFNHGQMHSLTEIAHLTGLPISTVHRLVSELAAWGMLERTDDASYRIGVPLKIIGRANQDPPTIHERARAVMEDLAAATRTDVRLGILDDLQVAYIEKVAGHRPLSAFTPAATLPAHATALGKALLAFSPARTVDILFAGGLKRYTAYTLTTPDRLRRALAETRLTCVAVSRSELTPGSNAIAAPVFGAGGSLLAALELRVNDLRSEVPHLQPALLIAARSLSRQLALLPPTTRHRPIPASALLVGSGRWTGDDTDRQVSLVSRRRPDEESEHHVSHLSMVAASE